MYEALSSGASELSESTGVAGSAGVLLLYATTTYSQVLQASLAGSAGVLLLYATATHVPSYY